MSDDRVLDNCNSHGIEEYSEPDTSDEALEAAADTTKIVFSLSSTGLVAPNCC